MTKHDNPKNQEPPKEEWRVTAVAECPTGLCEDCGMPVVFMLRHGDYDLPLDLFTVLKCLKLASERGHIPPVPEDWWLEVARSYGEDVKP